LESNDFFKRGTYNILKAEVAELADALGSGSSGRKAVRVQLPPSAPYGEENKFKGRFFVYLKQPEDIKREIGGEICLG
jgi:hypothetical protein